MLSREDNDILTQVGPGTPMGILMRRFCKNPVSRQFLDEMSNMALGPSKLHRHRSQAFHESP